MAGHGGSSAGSYLADPTSHSPLPLCCNYPVSKCPSVLIVVTSTLRVHKISKEVVQHPGLAHYMRTAATSQKLLVDKIR